MLSQLHCSKIDVKPVKPSTLNVNLTTAAPAVAVAHLGCACGSSSTVVATTTYASPLGSLKNGEGANVVSRNQVNRSATLNNENNGLNIP